MIRRRLVGLAASLAIVAILAGLPIVLVAVALGAMAVLGTAVMNWGRRAKA